MLSFNLKRNILGAVCIVFLIVMIFCICHILEQKKHISEQASSEYLLPSEPGGIENFDMDQFDNNLVEIFKDSENRGLEKILVSFVSLLGLNLSSVLEGEISFKNTRKIFDSPVTEIRTKEGCLLRFDGKTDILLKYGVPAYAIHELSKNKPLTEKGFRSFIVRLLESDVITSCEPSDAVFDIDSLKINRYNNKPIGISKESGNSSGTFQAFIPRVYRGHVCQSSILITADIETGVVTCIAHVPFVKPDSLDMKISGEQGLKIASDLLEQKKMNINGIKHEISTYITHPNNIWTMGEADEGATFGTNTKLCWLVQFKDESSGITVEVYVDCETGRVIGGMF